VSEGLNLTNIRISIKVAFTSYLIVMSCGLAMSGVQILLTHGMADGEFGLSKRDIVYSYYGNRENSRLEVKLNGTMKEMASLQDRVRIIEWVRQGASEERYENEIQSVFENNCIRCHGTVPGLIAFTTYDEIKPVAEIDDGASINALARVSHVHLFGMAFIFFFIVLIFSLSVSIPMVLKSVLIALPFAFLLIDILSWWLTKWYPNAAYLTMIGGAGYAIASTIMILTSLYQMWIMPRYTGRSAENTWLA
jgi:hypothetical protein